MKVGIFGMGAYGMALSSALIKNNCDITMWSKFEEEKEQLEKTRKNEKALPGFELSQSIKLTTSIQECAQDKDILIIVIPVPFIDSLCLELKNYVTNQHILIASKGIEEKTGLFAHEIVHKHIVTNNIAVISGPSFAVDLIEDLPQGLTLASNNKETISIVKKAFQSKNIKIEIVEDIHGVEICGSVKNIIAIASGMLAGLKVNDSTRAMFMVEAVNNMKYLLKVFNCNENTIMTYAGLGDLLLTCTSEKSRNYNLGILLGEKNSRDVIDKYIKETTVEGYNTLLSLHEILMNQKNNNQFFNTIYEIVVNGHDATELLNSIKENMEEI